MVTVVMVPGRRGLQVGKLPITHGQGYRPSQRFTVHVFGFCCNSEYSFFRLVAADIEIAVLGNLCGVVHRYTAPQRPGDILNDAQIAAIHDFCAESIVMARLYLVAVIGDFTGCSNFNAGCKDVRQVVGEGGFADNFNIIVRADHSIRSCRQVIFAGARLDGAKEFRAVLGGAFCYDDVCPVVVIANNFVLSSAFPRTERTISFDFPIGVIPKVDIELARPVRPLLFLLLRPLPSAGRLHSHRR